MTNQEAKEKYCPMKMNNSNVHLDERTCIAGECMAWVSGTPNQDGTEYGWCGLMPYRSIEVYNMGRP